jgi:hypothetical protein
VPCEAPGLAACRMLHWRTMVCPVAEQERGGGSSGGGAASSSGGGGANSRGALLAALNKARRDTPATLVTCQPVLGPGDGALPHLPPLQTAGRGHPSMSRSIGHHVNRHDWLCAGRHRHYRASQGHRRHEDEEPRRPQRRRASWRQLVARQVCGCCPQGRRRRLKGAAPPGARGRPQMGRREPGATLFQNHAFK